MQIVTVLASQDMVTKILDGKIEINRDKPDGIASQRAEVLGDFFNVDSSLFIK